MGNKRNQPPLVSTEAANRIRSFAHDLAALCHLYQVDIRNLEGGIELVDEKRKTLLRNYEYDAKFAGCDSAGVFQMSRMDHHKIYTGIRIEDLVPEDWCSPEKGVA